MSFHILTWNVFDSQENRDRRICAIKQVLQFADADLVALQETWGDEQWNSMIDDFRKEGYHVAATHYPGLTILSRLPILMSYVIHTSTGIRALRSIVHLRRSKLIFTNVRLPWGEDFRDVRERTLTELRASTHVFDRAEILAGDLNSEPWSSPLTALMTTQMNRPFTNTDPGLSDTCRIDNPLAARYCDVPCKLDYVFVRGPLRSLSSQILAEKPIAGVYPSDHAAIYVELELIS